MPQIPFTTQSVNNPAAVSTGPTALNVNANRLGWAIQNQSGSNPLFIKLGSGCTTTAYHFVLKPGSTASDGNGGSITQTEGAVYGGAITVAGSTPTYTVLEMGGI